MRKKVYTTRLCYIDRSLDGGRAQVKQWRTDLSEEQAKKDKRKKKKNEEKEDI